MTRSTGTRLAYISRNVANLARSVAFYCDRLDFIPTGPTYAPDPALVHWLGLTGGGVKARRLRYGRDTIELVEVGHHGRRYPAYASAADLVFQHIALRCRDIDAACTRLWQPSATAVMPGRITQSSPDPGQPEAVQLPAKSGAVRAFKFRDPDGHPLELLELPDDPGQTAMRLPGIDHSAISVSDTNRSIEYYATQLGMRVITKQINHGAQQCRLDGLDVTQVEVVALAPGIADSMHVELLGYHPDALRPTHTALLPQRVPCDIASDRLVFDMVSLPVRRRWQSREYCMADPDGHYLVLTAEPIRRN